MKRAIGIFVGALRGTHVRNKPRARSPDNSLIVKSVSRSSIFAVVAGNNLIKLPAPSAVCAAARSYQPAARASSISYTSIILRDTLYKIMCAHSLRLFSILSDARVAMGATCIPVQPRCK